MGTLGQKIAMELVRFWRRWRWWRRLRRYQTPFLSSCAHLLPDEVVQVVALFLSGFDVLALSHVNRAFYLQLSTEAVWKDRIPRSYAQREARINSRRPLERCWQRQAYASMHSVLSIPRDWSAPTSVLVSRSFNASRSSGFSIDMWLCVLPQVAPKQLATDTHLFFPYHDPMIQVEPGRWFHLALVSSDAEAIYVDGECISTRGRDGYGNLVAYQWSGELHATFFGQRMDMHGHHLSNMLVFHGLIDEVREWDQTLSTDEVKMLAQHKTLHHLNPMHSICNLSFDGKEGYLVRTPRPIERFAKLISKRMVKEWERRDQASLKSLHLRPARACYFG